MTLEIPHPLRAVDDLLSTIVPQAQVFVFPPCLDYDATDYQIHPCPKCESWWAEVVRDTNGQLVVREWHESSCEVLHEIEWE